MGAPGCQGIPLPDNEANQNLQPMVTGPHGTGDRQIDSWHSPRPAPTRHGPHPPAKACTEGWSWVLSSCAWMVSTTRLNRRLGPGRSRKTMPRGPPGPWKPVPPPREGLSPSGSQLHRLSWAQAPTHGLPAELRNAGLPVTMGAVFCFNKVLLLVSFCWRP